MTEAQVDKCACVVEGKKQVSLIAEGTYRPGQERTHFHFCLDCTARLISVVPRHMWRVLWSDSHVTLGISRECTLDRVPFWVGVN